MSTGVAGQGWYEFVDANEMGFLFTRVVLFQWDAEEQHLHP